MTATDTLPLGRPLKGILKNNQCSTLPRQNCSCGWGEAVADPEPPTIAELSTDFGCQPADLLYFSANISCDASEKLNKDEVLDTVESSV